MNSLESPARSRSFGRSGASRDEAARRLGRAWLGLGLALALHVADEAAHGFLAVFNPLVASLRERVGWLPVPVFSFRVWLGLLVVAVLLWLAVTPLAYRNALWLRKLALVLGGLMVLNAVAHLAITLALGRVLPGLWTAPLLLAAALYQIRAARRAAPP